MKKQLPLFAAHQNVANREIALQPVSMFPTAIKVLLIAFFGLLFALKTTAQYTATWPLLSAPQKTGTAAGPDAASVTVGDMVPGASFVTNGAHNADGFKCQLAVTGTWPTAPTDGLYLDFPLSPAAGFDATITGLTLTAKISSSSGNNLLQLAYQVDGAGPWILFGSPVTANSGGTSNLNFGALSASFFNGHTYVVRLYIYAAGNNTNQGRQVFIRNVVFSGTTAVGGTPPTVTTDLANATGKYTATANGTITAGTIPATASGICWSINANPSLSDNVVPTNPLVTTGSFSANISGLTANTTYHVRAYVTTAAGTLYGADLIFTTAAAEIPVLTTKDPNSFTILARAATSGGIFSDSGGVAITAKGVVFNTTGTPTLPGDNPTSDGQFAVDYNSALTGLTPATQYFVRAYATNSVGTGYGDVKTFTTAAQTTEIIILPSNLDFGDVILNSISATKTFSVEGYILSPAEGDITIQAPSGYQVSSSAGAGYSSSITVHYTGGTLNPTTIYVRLTPNTFGAFNGNITVTGGNATAQNVAVSGRGVQSPGDFSNKGTDFWVGYATHNLMYDNATDLSDDGGDQSMVLYFTSDLDAIVSVTIPGLNLTIASGLVVPANTVQAVSIPKSLGGTLPPDVIQLYREGKFNSAIHIVSDNAVPIVAYAHIYGNLVSGATLLLPTHTWSTEYYAISSPQITSSGSSTGSYNYLFVIADQDNTTVEITPTVNTLGGSGVGEEAMIAGQTYTRTLNKGQIYNILAVKNGGEDVSGTRVKSTDCTRKIAVFSGSGRVGIPSACSSSPSSDNLFSQVFPSVAWGTKYLTSRTTGTISENVFRVCVKDPLNTTITVNGIALVTAYPAAVLTNNFFYEFRDSLPLKIEANKPVMVAQYTQSVQGCTDDNGNVSGDPEMILLSPVQQAIKNVTLYSPSNQQISFPYINVIIANAGVSSFTLGGVNKAASFIVHPQDAGYSYASFSAADGINLDASVTLSSSVGFTAIAYGFADATQGGSNPRRESYGYNAGTQLNDLSTPLIIQNPYGGPINSSSQTLTTCRGTDFTFAATLPYETNKITFGFLGNPQIGPTNTDTTIIAATGNIPFDSSFVSNGVTYYVYRLSTKYNFSALGDYPVQITSFNPTSDAGCPGGSDKTINYTIKVVAGVTANFGIEYNTCVNDSVKLTDQSDGLGYIINKWTWSYNNGSSPLPDDQSALQNPKVKNPADNAGNNYTLRAVNEIGCYNDVTKVLPPSDKPTVTLAPLAGVCANAQVVTLNGSPAGGNYTGTGVTGSSFNPATSGPGSFEITYTYSTPQGCKDSAKQTIVVSPTGNLSITAVGPLCIDGQAVTLVPSAPGGVFSSPDAGLNGSSFDPAIAGVGTHRITYSATGGCSLPGSIDIVVNALPQVNAGPDQTIVQRGSAILGGSGSTGTYLWTPSTGLSDAAILTPTARPATTTRYTLTVTSNGCSAKDSMDLTVIPICLDPSLVFTPNNDGFYDKWVVFGGDCVQNIEVHVYNRWGSEVYQSKRYLNDWDGTYKSKPLPDGTYYYVINALLVGTNQVTVKGNVTIMR